MTQRVIIMGAAGRDFHNFNVFFRDNPHYEVVAFTATQIPYIENRRYPPELAGPDYPQGIPILGESELEQLISEHTHRDRRLQLQRCDLRARHARQRARDGGRRQLHVVGA